MARARNLKPGFFRNEILAELPPLSRLLFAGLWTIADKAGRLEDRPKRIKADVLPYDNGDVSGMLDQLAGAGFIVRYAANGERYIQITNFGKHQNPHVKEGESIIPAPDETGEHHASTVQAPDKHDASFPLTDSLNPLMGNGEPIDTAATATDSPTTPEIPKTSKSKDGLSEVQRQRFDRWYRAYPRKVKPLEAAKAWAKITPAPTDAQTDQMIAKVQEWTGSIEWSDPQYIPHPATWLNGGRWNDGPPIERITPKGGLTVHKFDRPTTKHDQREENRRKQDAWARRHGAYQNGTDDDAIEVTGVVHERHA